jgi:general secretion pathway protein M
MSSLKQLKIELANRVTQSRGWQRWQQLPSRDRSTLLWLAGGVALLLFYAFVWLPLERKVDASNARYQQEREFLSYLHEQAPTLRRATPHARSSLSPERLQGLVLERLDSEGGGRLLISLAQAPFDKIVRWLQELEEKGVTLFEVSLERSGVGKVDARLAVGVDGL